MKEKDEALKLENQLCFPLYAASKELVKKYTPILNKLDLTYTQYIVMMVMWEKQSINVKDLGEMLYLDSGTLTPLLKKLEAKNYLKRSRSTIDERVVNIDITREGQDLKNQALEIPGCIGMSILLNSEEASQLYSLLYKLLDGFKENLD